MASNFSCRLCGKNFDNSKSQIRHNSYCRKKAKNPPKPRKKSCLRCTRAKTHCDTEHPSCSRCLDKGFACSYQTKSRSPLENNLRQGLSQNEVQSSKDSPQSATSSQLSMVQSYEYSESYNVGPFNQTHEHIFQPQDFLNGVYSVYGESGNIPIGDLACCTHLSPIIIGSHKTTGALENHASSIIPSLLQQPTFQAPRSFTPKAIAYRQLSLNRKFIICTFSAYPHILLPGKSLPPFIHPHCLAKDLNYDNQGDSTSLPGPLSTCAGIIAMLSVRNKNNTAFIWRAIWMEQERLWEECSGYNDWDAVAALQAITIYFLLRLSEKDESVTNFDVPLILTMTQLSLKVLGVTSRHCKPSIDLPPTWEG